MQLRRIFPEVGSNGAIRQTTKMCLLSACECFFVANGGNRQSRHTLKKTDTCFTWTSPSSTMVAPIDWDFETTAGQSSHLHRLNGWTLAAQHNGDDGGVGCSVPPRLLIGANWRVTELGCGQLCVCFVQEEIVGTEEKTAVTWPVGWLQKKIFLNISIIFQTSLKHFSVFRWQIKNAIQNLVVVVVESALKK